MQEQEITDITPITELPAKDDNITPTLEEQGFNRDEAQQIIKEFGSKKLQAFMRAMQSGKPMRIGHEGKHNIARAERAKARISHRKNKRKKR